MKQLLLSLAFIILIQSLAFSAEFENDSARYEFIFNKFEYSEVILTKNFNRDPFHIEYMREMENYIKALNLFYSSQPSILNHLYKMRNDTNLTYWLVGWNAINGIDKIIYKNRKDSLQNKYNATFILALNYLFNDNKNIIKLSNLSTIDIVLLWQELEKYILTGDKRILIFLKKVYKNDFHYYKLNDPYEDDENSEEREMEYNPLKVQKWKICKSKKTIDTVFFENTKVIFNKDEKFIYLFSDQVAYFKSGIYLHIDSSDVEIIDNSYYKLEFSDKFLETILKRDFSLQDDELKLVLEKHNIDVKQLVFLRKYDTKKLFLDYVNLIEEMQLNAGAGESYTYLLFIIVSQIEDSKLVQYLENLNSRNLKLFKHELIDYTKDFGIEEPLKYFASFYPQTLYFLYSID